jgi:hypothetical protein
LFEDQSGLLGPTIVNGWGVGDFAVSLDLNVGPSAAGATYSLLTVGPQNQCPYVNAGPDNPSLHLALIDGDELVVDIQDDVQYVTLPALDDNAWHQIQVVRENEGVTVTVDGASVTATPLSMPESVGAGRAQVAFTPCVGYSGRQAFDGALTDIYLGAPAGLPAATKP